MCRSACLILIAACLLCGCGRKEAEPEPSEMPQPPTVGAEANVPETPEVPEAPAAATVPAGAAAPALNAAREFLSAFAAGDYERAVALTRPGIFTTGALAQIGQVFQMDKAKIVQAWLGADQAVVITNFIPLRQGTLTGAWAFGLTATEQDRWLVHDADFLAQEQAVENHVAGFRQIEPNAVSVEP